MAEGVELDYLQGPLQPKPFCDSMILSLSQLFYQLANWLAHVLGQQGQTEWQKAAEDWGGGEASCGLKTPKTRHATSLHVLLQVSKCLSKIPEHS